jgi:hypothetical protein
MGSEDWTHPRTASGGNRRTAGEQPSHGRADHNQRVEGEQLAGCPRCGATTRRLGPGKGPHAGLLECAGCGRWIAWLSIRDWNDLHDSEMQELQQQQSREPWWL